MSAFVAYHRASAEIHQQRVDELAPLGYRPISLNVSGDFDSPVYAAVWLQRPGPEWEAVHNVDEDGYQQRFEEIVGRGLTPVLVSATGRAGRATYVALFERRGDVRWFARHRIGWDELVAENTRAFAEGYVPSCLAVYGDPADRRFAGVWTNNDEIQGGPVMWSWWWTDPDAYQRYFDGELAAGVRPAHVSVAPDGFQLSVFRDQPIGEFRARHRIGGDEYQDEFDADVADGLMPIMVQAGGTGDATRYAAVFAPGPDPIQRSWNVSGADRVGIGDLDGFVQGFMRDHSIRAGAVAVAEAGRVVASRGYTWAEPGYKLTEPGTTFRVASVSKMFTCAAIDHLVSSGQLGWSTQAFALIGITSVLLASQTADPATATITIDQLVHRTSGLQHDFGADLRTIAAQLGQSSPPTRDQLVRYLYGVPLDNPPGMVDSYSNSAIDVLASVVEAVTGRAFIDVLRTDVLAPMGISDVTVASTLADGMRADEVPSYDHPGVSLSQLKPSTIDMDANTHGGTFVLEHAEGAGGLVTSAPTIARFIGTHAVWNVGGREPRFTRHGDFDGTCSGASSRDDGLDLGYVFNRRVTADEHDQLTSQLNQIIDRNGSDWARPGVSERLDPKRRPRLPFP